MIREATASDIPRIVEMGRRFLLEGPYRHHLRDSPEVPTRLAQKLLQMPGARILVADEEGHLIGVFAFMVYEHYYSGESVAGELIWYVEPEHRILRGWGESVAYDLLRKAEELASELGAVKMQLTAPTEAVGKLYERIKYEKIEVSYQKNLQSELVAAPLSKIELESLRICSPETRERSACQSEPQQQSGSRLQV